MRRLARRNTQIYEDLFGALPSDSVQTWQQLAQQQTPGFDFIGDFYVLPFGLMAYGRRMLKGSAKKDLNLKDIFT